MGGGGGCWVGAFKPGIFPNGRDGAENPLPKSKKSGGRESVK